MPFSALERMHVPFSALERKKSSLRRQDRILVVSSSSSFSSSSSPPPPSSSFSSSSSSSYSSSSSEHVNIGGQSKDMNERRTWAKMYNTVQLCSGQNKTLFPLQPRTTLSTVKCFCQWGKGRGITFRYKISASLIHVKDRGPLLPTEDITRKFADSFCL